MRRLLALLVLSCSSTTTVHGIFVTPDALNELTDVHYYDHPFPSDYRRDPDGTIHIGGMLNPTLDLFVQQYEDATVGLLDGFSPAAAAYFTFDGDLDTTTLPQQPTDALSSTSSLQLVDVDPSSPEHGHRKLIQWYFRSSSETSLYWVPDTLAVAPARGYPLRPHTQYALVVTRDVKSFDGGIVLPSKDLLEVLELLPMSGHSQTVHDLFAPAVAELEGAGVSRDQIAQLTVFTTNDPTAELFQVVDAEKADFPAPTINPSSWKAVSSSLYAEIYEGVYGPSPNYQAGNIPFQNAGDGGGFDIDSDGHPVLQSTFDMRFSLVVPTESLCPMPKNGYPLALYAHGTGGDFESVWREIGGFGTTLPPKCVAAMGVDQIFHGARPGAPPPGPNYENAVDLLFFNLFNPIAARTNGRQGAIDVVQQARLFTETHATIPSVITFGGREISFDPTRLLFVGHSQGGVNGPLFLAADDQTRGGVLSGTGAMITVALLEKTQPAPSVAAAVRTILSLNGSQYDDELNLFHPIINLAQTIVDTTDPLHYMPYIISNPRHGIAKSIYQTEGIAIGGSCATDADCQSGWQCNPQLLCELGDSYAPPDGIEIASVALGLPRELPGVRVIPNDAWGGVADVLVPQAGLSGNLANGKASGVLGQFPPAPGSDGHFIVFDVPACQGQAAQFLQNLANDPKGNVPPLPAQ
jgi:hypothetical protein